MAQDVDAELCILISQLHSTSMRYRLSPIWLFTLYSVAGYTEAEIADLGGWSLKSIQNGLKKWEIRKPTRTSEERTLRKYIDMVRETQGNEAARVAVCKFSKGLRGRASPSTARLGAASEENTDRTY
jgi:hypothetical protein